MLYKGVKHCVSLNFQSACLVLGEEERKSIVWQSPLRDVTLKAKQKTLPLQLLHYLLNCLEKLLFLSRHNVKSVHQTEFG